MSHSSWAGCVPLVHLHFHSCRAGFQSLQQLRARQHKEEELDVPLLPALAFSDLTSISSCSRVKIFACDVGYSLLLCSDLSHVSYTEYFSGMSPQLLFPSLQNSSASSNSVRFLRAFCSQFQVFRSFASFYLLILILPSMPAFRSPFYLTKWFSCIFQYHFPCMAYHSWIIHKALVSSHLSSAFIMKVCSISGSEKGQLG